MTEFLRQLWEPIKKLPRNQQIVLAVATVLVIIGITVATTWGTKKEYVHLFAEPLKLADAGKIVAKMKELNISFKLGKDSTDIRVPLTDKPYILLQLSQEKSLPKAKAGWSELIDKRSILSGTTQQEFDLNYVRGLEKTIEETLVKMAPIDEANVSIVKPKREVFKEDQKDPSASVLLKLKPGVTITKDQVRAIRDWLCTAVQGLKPDEIRIADTNARDLTKLIDDDAAMSLDKVETAQLKYTEEREKRLKRELQSQLERIFGYGKAVVRVRLKIDFDKKEAVSDVVIPPVDGKDNGVVVSEKLENEEYQGKDLVEDGEPGVNSNLPPGAPAYPGTDNSTWNKYKRNGQIKNYLYTHSKEKFTKDQGSITRLTVSVVLDGNQKALGKIQDQIIAIAKTTVGFDKKRGDKLALMVIPFKNDELDRAKAAFNLKKQQEKQMFKIIMGLLMSFPVLLGLIYIFVRVSRARALVREQERLQAAVAEAEAIAKIKNEQAQRQSDQQWRDWERKFKDIKNFFPEITDFAEKKKKVQDLRYAAYKYAADNDELPPDFEEMTPEEQYIYREAFKKKKDGTLEAGLKRLGSIIEERDKQREEELAKLQGEASARDELEDRVRNLVETKPDDAISVLRLWLNE